MPYRFGTDRSRGALAARKILLCLPSFDRLDASRPASWGFTFSACAVQGWESEEEARAWHAAFESAVQALRREGPDGASVRP